jgi:hypothetical protein
MADINFISDNKDGRKKKSDDEKKKQKIEWTKPIGERAALPDSSTTGPKDKSSGWFSFLKKRKKQIPKDDKKSGLLDKEQVKRSRREVLKLIKEQEDKRIATGPKPEKKKKDKDKGSSWWSNLFKRKTSHKKISPDDKGMDKNKKDLPAPDRFPAMPAHAGHAEQISADKQAVEKELPIKQDKSLKEEKIFKLQHHKKLTKKDKTHINNTLKVKKESLLDRLINFWRSFTKKRTQIPVKAELGATDKLRQKMRDNSRHVKKVELKNGKKEKEERKDKKKIRAEKNEKAETWESSNILETNLIKGELASFFNWKKGIIILLLNITFACLIVAGVYKGLILWGKQEMKQGREISSKIDELDEQIKPLEEYAGEVLIMQKKIKLVSDLLKKHIYWTNFFEFLEENTHKDVYYVSGFSGSNNGEYALSARAKNFKTISEQVDALRLNDYVVKAGVSGGNIEYAKQEDEAREGETPEEKSPKEKIVGVNFQLKLSIDPGIFTK